MAKKRSLADDENHQQQTHYRWLDKLSLKHPTDPEQCFACRYYIALSGYLSLDWGACSNPQSPFDGRVMYEHDGCEFIDYTEDDDVTDE